VFNEALLKKRQKTVFPEWFQRACTYTQVASKEGIRLIKIPENLCSVFEVFLGSVYWKL
jgi:hypothetical protein